MKKIRHSSEIDVSANRANQMRSQQNRLSDPEQLRPGSGKVSDRDPICGRSDILTQDTLGKRKTDNP